MDHASRKGSLGDLPQRNTWEHILPRDLASRSGARKDLGLEDSKKIMIDTVAQGM